MGNAYGAQTKGGAAAEGRRPPFVYAPLCISHRILVRFPRDPLEIKSNNQVEVEFFQSTEFDSQAFDFVAPEVLDLWHQGLWT